MLCAVYISEASDCKIDTKWCMSSLSLNFWREKTKLNKHFASQSNGFKSKSKQEELMNLTSIHRSKHVFKNSISKCFTKQFFIFSNAKRSKIFFNLIFKRNVIYEVSNATLGQHHLTTLYAKVSRKWGEKFRTLTFWKTRQSVGTLLWMAYIASPIY